MSALITKYATNGIKNDCVNLKKCHQIETFVLQLSTKMLPNRNG